MVIRTRLQGFDRDARLELDALLSPEAMARDLAAYARQELAKAQAQDAAVLGAVPPHTTFVDGREGASEDSVKVPGTIVYEFALVDDLLLYIAETLARHSPYRSGRYTAAHALYADGVAVAPDAAPPGAAEYVFTNTVPYARKIERGLSPQAPDGVFEVAATMASRRYGNLARIRFTYRNPLGGGTMLDEWAGARLGGRTDRKALRAHQTDTRQPAIVVTVR